MSDNTILHFGENSPEKIAYVLLQEIANIEGQSTSPWPTDGFQTTNRKWLLDTYAECLKAVRGFRSFE